VENAVDFDDILPDPIDCQKRKADKHKLTGAWLPSSAATAGKLHETAQSLVDSERRAARGFRAVVLLGVIANVCEVAATVGGTETFLRLLPCLKGKGSVGSRQVGGARRAVHGQNAPSARGIGTGLHEKRNSTEP
jgi:hypothetical protein